MNIKSHTLHGTIHRNFASCLQSASYASAKDEWTRERPELREDFEAIERSAAAGERVTIDATLYAHLAQSSARGDHPECAQSILLYSQIGALHRLGKFVTARALKLGNGTEDVASEVIIEYMEAVHKNAHKNSEFLPQVVYYRTMDILTRRPKNLSEDGTARDYTSGLMNNDHDETGSESALRTARTKASDASDNSDRHTEDIGLEGILMWARSHNLLCDTDLYLLSASSDIEGLDDAGRTLPGATSNAVRSRRKRARAALIAAATEHRDTVNFAAWTHKARDKNFLATFVREYESTTFTTTHEAIAA